MYHARKRLMIERGRSCDRGEFMKGQNLKELSDHNWWMLLKKATDNITKLTSPIGQDFG